MPGATPTFDRRRFLELTATLTGATLIPASLVRTAEAATPAGPTAYAFSPPPVIGAHPRVVLDPTDLGSLRTRVTSGLAKQNYDELKRRATGLATHPLLAKLEQGGTLTDTEQEQLGKLVATTALAALIGDDGALAATAARAAVAWAQRMPAGSAGDFSRSTHAIALAYDYGHGFLDDGQRDLLRGWIAARVTAYEQYLDGQPYGFQPVANRTRDDNWAPHYVGAFGAAALVIEGEEGYQSRWYDKSAARLHTYLTYGVGPEGAPLELVHYFAYGMWQGSYLLNAMVRRGDAVLDHPHLRKVPQWWTSDQLPWGRLFNGLADTRQAFGGVPPIYYLLRLAYPDDPVMRWVYANVINRHLQAPDPLEGVLWVSDPDASDGSRTAAELGLDPSQLYLHSGLTYLRDAWGTDDIYFQFQSDPLEAGQSHGHADRNSFTLAGKHRLWIIDTGGFVPQDAGHNLVFVDGLAEGYFPHRGHVMSWADGGWATGIMGDAKLAYDWRTHRIAQDPEGWQLVDGLWSYPYNPVRQANRSGVLVRGAHPYAVVVDDVVKDDAVHDYTWEAMLPLGTVVTPVDERSVLLEPVYTGPSLVSGRTPLQVPVTVPAAGSCRVWLLTGREYADPWQWQTQVSLDGGATVVAGAGEQPHSECAMTHWLSVRLGTAGVVDLAAGAHTFTLTTTATMAYAAILLAPPSYDPTGAAPEPPPVDSIRVDLADLTPPTGWTRRAAEPNPPRCLVHVVAPAGVAFETGTFDRIRSNGEDYGRILKLRVRSVGVEGRFRVLLYPHRAGDPLPIVDGDGARATVGWPGDTDEWRFGAAGGLDAANEAAVRVTRDGESVEVNVSFASLNELTARFVTDGRARTRLLARLRNARLLHERDRRDQCARALGEYIDEVRAATPSAVTPHHAGLLIRQATVLRA